MPPDLKAHYALFILPPVYQCWGGGQYSTVKVLCLLGMGFVKAHVVEFRFLKLVRTKRSRKLTLLKLCLPLEIGKDEENHLRAAVSLVVSSEAFKASELKVRIFYNLMKFI